MKKISLYLFTLFAFILKPVLAQSGDAVPTSIDGLLVFIQQVLVNLSTLFSLRWVDGYELAFLKMLLWILVFTILYFAGQVVFAKHKAPNSPGKKISLIVALIMATSTVLFIPDALLVSLFASYASVIVFVFMGVIIGTVIKIVYGDWLKTQFAGPTLHVIRILGLILCWMILSTITQYADARTGVSTFSFIILPIIFINFKNINSLSKNKDGVN